MVARIGPVDEANLARVVQLINKTNQFNLTTRRRNRAELEAFLARPDTEAFWVRLADKFADHGLIAVALAEAKGEALAIDTLLMSCRVIGRGVEALVLAELAGRAAARGCAGSRAPMSRPSATAWWPAFTPARHGRDRVRAGRHRALLGGARRAGRGRHGDDRRRTGMRAGQGTR